MIKRLLNYKLIVNVFWVFLFLFNVPLVNADDQNGWNLSRRYMAHGICDNNQQRNCKGDSHCDNGSTITQCTSCEEINGWYQYQYLCTPCSSSLPYPKCDPKQTGFKVGGANNCATICGTYVAAGNFCSNINGEFCVNEYCELACQCGECYSGTPP